MVDTPSEEHVGAVVVIVGTAGVTNIAALLNEVDADEVHVALPDVTV